MRSLTGLPIRPPSGAEAAAISSEVHREAASHYSVHAVRCREQQLLLPVSGDRDMLSEGLLGS